MSDYNPVLKAPRGANKKPKRVGRGSSSGLGTTTKVSSPVPAAEIRMSVLKVDRCLFTGELPFADFRTLFSKRSMFASM